MPRSRPATTGYERLAQADQFSDDSDDDDPLSHSYASLQPAAAPRYAPISQPRPHSGMSSPKGRSSSHARGQSRSTRPRRRPRSNSGVDLKAINARLERWADEIASKFKRGRHKKTGEEERLEIHHSVFQAPEGVRPVTAEMLATPEPGYMTRQEFEAIVDSVRHAIQQGTHPRMISQGSSGSYFARNPDGKVVGVFKPKDEEPYAAGNPKWNKWIHRNLFPCCFGRACLIPNLSYVSEAAAYVLDAQLRTHMVPYTDVVYLSSKSFHYPFWDRYNFSRKKKALPAKPGSFQVFLKGFKDANVFLREHPWPDQYLSGFRTTDPHRKRKRRWADTCRPAAAADAADSEDEEAGSPQSLTPGPDNFVWTPSLKQSFREELEKLVILDYIMRNTDRGLDNWMIKIDWENQAVSVASEPMHLNMSDPAEAGGGPSRGEDDEVTEAPRPVDLSQRAQPKTRALHPYRTQRPMEASSATGSTLDPKITIGAIDNSLSWPWKHPDAWRSFPFGWLFLPVDLIGRPFSQKTRDHFLPLLTSTAWWSQTQLALRRVFQMDPDFQERMFAKQIAVMKGQAWNVVETLKTPDHGPLELTRRAKVCVWDDLVDVPVAVPMRVASAEMRRRAVADAAADTDAGGYHHSGHNRTASEAIAEEEMDIGAVGGSTSGVETTPSSAPTVTGAVDLLSVFSAGPATSPSATSVPPMADLPHPGRFELALGSEPVTPMTPNIPNGGATWSGAGDRSSMALARPPLGRSSLSHPRPSLNLYSPERGAEASGSNRHERRFSFATPASRRESNSIAAQLYLGEEDYEDGLLDGDLGYAAAQGMEGNQRKVIVERLEAVKGGNPVFTCW